MSLPRAPLLLLWAGLGSFVPGSRCGSPRHSLCYSYLKVSESSQGLPQFLSVILLDDQPIARYVNHTSKVEPLVPWMGAEEATILEAPERMFRADLEWLSKLNHQTEGLHTWQAILGCELRENRSKGVFLHYGYNGMDFISFDKETHRWLAAQPQAQKVKEKWEDDPKKSQRNKIYLEDLCIQIMQKYLSYQKESLKKAEPPVGQVNSKVVDDSLEVLICQAHGFYPKEIQATWTRDGEICQYETLPRNVAPNSDGTYYLWLSIEIDPKERRRFQCRLEHEGLQEPLVLAFKEEPATWWWIPWAIVVPSILGAGILFLIGWLWRRHRKRLLMQWWKRCKNNYQEVTTCHVPQIIFSPSVDGREDEIKSQRLSQTKITSEYKASNGLQRTWSESPCCHCTGKKERNIQCGKCGVIIQKPRSKQDPP